MLVFLLTILYLYYMRERLIALIVFLMVTGHPCRLRVMPISVRYFPKTEMIFIFNN
jgi:hypothetical protein